MKIKAILKTNYKPKDGLYPICISISIPKTSAKRPPIGIRIKKSDWDDRLGAVRDTHPNYAEINIKIKEQLIQLEKKYLIGTPGDYAYAVESGGNFYWYFQKHIDAAHKRGSHRRAEADEGIMRVLKGWRDPWMVADISSESLESIREFLKDRGNSPNCISDRMTRIRTTVNKYKLSKEPLDYKIRFMETSSSELGQDDVETLRNADIPETWRQAIRARDMWLFSLNAAGMRWGDLCRLRVFNVANGRIDWIMHKSVHAGGKRVNIPQTPEAKAILEKYLGGKSPEDYVFPVLSGRYVTEAAIQKRIHNVNSNVNHSLKKVYRHFKLKARPTMHMARHTFGDKVDDAYILRNLFGHGSVTTTEKYKKRRSGGKNDEAVLNAMK